MDEKTIKDPQIYVSKEARKLYDYIRDLEEFKDLKPENKDLLLMALALGYKHGKKRAIDQKEREASGFTRERYLSNTDNGILKAIAIAENESIEIIKNTQQVYQLAQDYANGGIDFLKELVLDNPASFIKKFASELRKALAK